LGVTGLEIYADNLSEVFLLNINDDEIIALEVPDAANTWPMNTRLLLMNALEA
jgi:hypothetical protein